MVRVQSNPWLGYDHRIAVDVSRALGIGLQFVLVSNSGQQEVQECVEVSRDWHRKALTIHPYSGFDEWGAVHDRTVEETYVIPQPETKQALDDIEDMIKTPGIKAVFIAMTDASRVITGSHQPDFYDPRLWEYVDRAVEVGREHGIRGGSPVPRTDRPRYEASVKAGLAHSSGSAPITSQAANGRSSTTPPEAERKRSGMQTAGKRRSGRTRKGSKWLRANLTEAATAASRTKDTSLQVQYQRPRARRGHARAFTAVAHSMLTAAWHILSTDEVYTDPAGDYFTRRNPERTTRRLIAQLEKLGHHVTLQAAPSAQSRYPD